MSRTIGHRSAWVAVLLLGAAAFLACNDTRDARLGPAGTLADAKSGSITVKSANPSFGRQGQIGEAVAIGGSGFIPGAQASWQRNGVTDTTIAVLSTQYVSSTQLIATINISTTAAIDFYDIAVTQTDRTKGAGSDAAVGGSLFEVTQAVAISGTNGLYGVNNDGEITGHSNGSILGPIYWSASSGLLLVERITARGHAISPLGNAIVGNGTPHLWTRSGPVGTPWQRTDLPTDSGVTVGGAWTMVSDPATGQVVLIGGREQTGSAKGTPGIFQPLLWVPQPSGGGWRMIRLSTGSAGQGTLRRLSQDSIAVGMLGSATIDGRATSTTQAAAWQPDGLGGWSLITLAPVPSAAEAINTAGTLVVGASGGAAAYWQRQTNSTWSGPIALPGGCTDARGVDDSGRIAADGCTFFKAPTTVFVPPYSPSSIIHLGGFGPNSGAGSVEGMSPSGQWVVGWLGGTNAAGGVYWKLF
jgi:hypothetical protein